MRIIAVYDDYAHAPEIEYAFDLLLSPYATWYEVVPLDKLGEYSTDGDIIISYGKTPIPSSHIHIYQSPFFNEPFVPAGIGAFWAEPPAPSTFAGAFWPAGSNITDILALSFSMVTRYEETVSDAHDAYGRFPASTSIAYRNGFLDIPEVNVFIELLWSRLQELGVEKKPIWPDGKEFATCLTHDVDVIRRFRFPRVLVAIGASLVRRHSPKEAIEITTDYLRVLLGGKCSADSFDYIVDSEQALGVIPTFYFMASNSRWYRAEETIQRRDVAEVAKRMKQLGCEVGLHGSYDSYDDQLMAIGERNRIANLIGDNQSKSFGSRQHYLRWSNPYTWRIAENLGVLYDSTLGYPEQVGFRCGMCLPFKPFDLRRRRVMDLWELPLTVMDSTLMDYRGLTPEEGYEETIRLIEEVKKVNGVAVLLWHNNSLCDKGRWKGWKETYRRVLEYLEGENVFIGGGKQIIDWYSQR